MKDNIVFAFLFIISVSLNILLCFVLGEHFELKRKFEDDRIIMEYNMKNITESYPSAELKE